jgi:hypothetical protein
MKTHCPSFVATIKQQIVVIHSPANRRTIMYVVDPIKRTTEIQVFKVNAKQDMIALTCKARNRIQYESHVTIQCFARTGRSPCCATNKVGTGVEKVHLAYRMPAARSAYNRLSPGYPLQGNSANSH